MQKVRLGRPAGRRNGGHDATSGAGDLFIAGTVKPHLEFAGAVAAMDDMRVTVDQGRCDQPT